MDQPAALLGFVFLTFALAGFVKGVIGLGLPTVAMGMLVVVMAPAQAAALLIVPSFITNVWQLAAGPSFASLARRLWLMLFGVCVGTWLGSGMLTADDGARAAIGLGVALALYAIAGLTSVEIAVPERLEPYLPPLVGTVTGIVTAATGVFVLPAVPYLQALRLEKDDLVQALGLSFTVSTLALAALLVHDGALPTGLAGTSLAALAPALIGMAIGQWLRGRVRPQTFRVCFFVGMLLLGGHLALRALI
jgi:uncharacterized protein